MSARRWFVLPHCGAWAIVYRIAGTDVLHVEATSLSYDLALDLCAELNAGVAA